MIRHTATQGAGTRHPGSTRPFGDPQNARVPLPPHAAGLGHQAETNGLLQERVARSTDLAGPQDARDSVCVAGVVACGTVQTFNQTQNFFKKASTKANHAKAWDAKLRPSRYGRQTQTRREAGTQSRGSLRDCRAAETHLMVDGLLDAHH